MQIENATIKIIKQLCSIVDLAIELDSFDSDDEKNFANILAVARDHLKLLEGECK